MHCFNHNDRDAVAICISCGMAICPSCVKRTQGDRIVCSDNCAQQLGTLLQSGRDGLARASRSYVVTAWYLWLLGGGLMAYGVFVVVAQANWDFAYYLLGFGAGSAVIGYFYYRLARRTPNTAVQPTAGSGG